MLFRSARARARENHEEIGRKIHEICPHCESKQDIRNKCSATPVLMASFNGFNGLLAMAWWMVSRIEIFRKDILLQNGMQNLV